MPRPTKCRKVCNLPTTQGFAPGEVRENTKAVILTIDEYETIRLIDREGFSQEECSASMQVARTTVQQIYTCARKKLATAIVDGIPIRIEGGNYQVCDGRKRHCRCCGCKKLSLSGHSQDKKQEG